MIFLAILAYQLINNGSIKWKLVGITLAGDDELHKPYDLAFNRKNQYFHVADYDNGRIQRYPGNSGDNRASVTVLKLNDSTS
ncbi:unnamed protein product, partial [Rotaria sp. Silwood1]